MLNIGALFAVVGYSVVLVALYPTSTSVFETATGGIGPALYSFVLPVVGIIGGIYAYRAERVVAVPLFVLGFSELASSFGALLSPNPTSFPPVVGLLGVVCATLAWVAGLLRVATFFRFGALRADAD
ncbi:hypothetical protein EKH57_03650 [Halorubrum sp. BOL3-1]|nr:hypothetical protein EKH57_03650 [Halorubrum sp. BOL3-1]